MNNLVPANVLSGEVLLPGTSVRVVGKMHPLRGDRIERYLDVGLTLEEMLREACGDLMPGGQEIDLFVCIDGHPIERSNWARVRAKPGTTVTFIPRLQGGSALKTVFSLVLAIAAIALSGPLGLALAGTGFLGISAGVASAFIAGGIRPIGAISLNAVFRNNAGHQLCFGDEKC